MKAEAVVRPYAYIGNAATDRIRADFDDSLVQLPIAVLEHLYEPMGNVSHFVE